MPDFQELLNSFIGLTKYSARFRRVVLHTHSPDSHDFGRGGDPELNNRQLLLDNEIAFVEHLEGQFDLVAITDHMKIGYACRLAKAVEKHPDLCILPGVELNVRLAPPFHSMRLHILAIFPHTKSVGEIERIFPNGIPDDALRVGQEEIVLDNTTGLVELANTIRSHDGICIAAHVDSNNGIRKLFRQTGKDAIRWFNQENEGTLSASDRASISESFRDYLVSARFEGIEVSKPEDRVHYTWETALDADTKHRVPVFLTFDAHTVEELANVGERATYIKMTDVSLDGLKSAIKFPDTRIRFSVDRIPPPHILGIEIISPSKDGFFERLRVGFVENLNCVIGPRGSGKSTIIDGLRYIFGYNRTLDELDSKDLKNAVLARQNKNLQNSIIRVGYQLSSNSVHFLEATYDAKSDYVTKVFDAEGNQLHVSDVERSGNYPLRLFGWSEIETLGRDPVRQLDLLDKLVSGLADLQEKQRRIRSDLDVNAKSIQRMVKKLSEILERNNSQIKHYSDYKQEFEKLNTPEVQAMFVELDNNRERLNVLRKVSAVVAQLRDRIQQIKPQEIDKELQDLVDSESEIAQWWLSLDQDDLHTIHTRKSVESKLQEISVLLQALIRRYEHQSGLLAQKIEEVEGKIRSAVSSDPGKQVLADLRTAAKKRLDDVEELREEYQDQYQELTDLFADRRMLIEGLEQVHQQISNLRRDKKTEIEAQLNEFQTPEMTISLDFESDGDRSLFQDVLSSGDCPQLSEVNYRFRANKWPELLASAVTPVEFTRYVWQKSFAQLACTIELDGKNYSLTEEQANGIVNALYPFAHDEMAGVETIDETRLDVLLNLEGIPWDDKERILRNGQPVDKASPGQRSSAMLPLIALAENVPLVIDQPEDNLDNRLVGKVLVDILAKLKEKRQIIVTTHNPNIVVLGDSEQVVVLDAVSDVEGIVKEPQASIDHPVIVKSVIELMEGGKDAFETRKMRYGV